MHALELRHTGIVVSDLEIALIFYRDYLGLTVSKDFAESGPYIDDLCQVDQADLRMVKLTTPDNGMIELLEFKSPKGTPQTTRPKNNDVGASHVAFTVANLQDTMTFLSDRSVEFSSGPCLSPDGYAKVAFCRDPDGTLIELVEVL
ncbi:MAG: catechol 2,3-dioxygenase-like lactoylglutathione lyase family enzyme [Candidatus Marinamargulisbacteria bacterium]|jgi:catechol 2,3-dioxygenase-like lactoylglutathione lyase family enzyme